jgi:hypothetical protein
MQLQVGESGTSQRNVSHVSEGSLTSMKCSNSSAKQLNAAESNERDFKTAPAS